MRCSLSFAKHDRPGALVGRLVRRRGVDLHASHCVRAEPAEASEGFGYLDEQPRLFWSDRDRMPDLVGGGWLACFGYDPKTTTMAFYDSLLRWQQDSGWCFESLGIERARSTQNAAALQYWTGCVERGVIAADSSRYRSALSASRRMLHPHKIATSLQ